MIRGEGRIARKMEGTRSIGQPRSRWKNEIQKRIQK